MQKERQNTPAPFVIHVDDVQPYAPANHTGTVNRRLIGQETVGARNIEVLHAILQPGHGALPHQHPHVEQVCYVVRGTAQAQVSNRLENLGPGDCCYFAAGVDHIFTATGDEPTEILVIYSPPYGEDPGKVVLTPSSTVEK
jgi:mannose-6-phosphate isomerase-like protein (cupin superfamily)